MTGGAVSASRKSIDYVLNSKPNGNVVVLVVSLHFAAQSMLTHISYIKANQYLLYLLKVGGAPESLDTHSDVEDIILILKPRKGFIKLALKHG